MGTEHRAPRPKHTRWPAVGVLALLLASGQAGCGTAPDAPEPPSITVLAAASLKPSFTLLAERFTADNPGTRVRFDFASSPDLATQLVHGATADVFASADTTQMGKVAAAGLVSGAPVTFASNTLVIITAPGNPKHVESFADLAEPGLALVISPPPMPCGVATQRVQEITGIHLDPVSAEPDVEDVLNKVVNGEADAGLVNRSDAVLAGDKVTTVTFPESAGAVSTYPIALLNNATRPELATKFIDLAVGMQGREILDRAGFGKP